jgi:hypothetical protein
LQYRETLFARGFEERVWEVVLREGEKEHQGGIGLYFRDNMWCQR